MSVVNFLLEQTAVYSLWQAPFAAKKLAPLLAHNDIRAARRVLDVGCGPGTNAHLFANSGYLGIDINPRYIEDARRKHNRNFLAADVTAYTVPEAKRYDFILINSFLHHIDTPAVRRILAHLRNCISPDGAVHILELVSPGDRSVAQFLADWDRGKFPRPLAEWKRLFAEQFALEVFEPYPLTGFGVTLWNMVYCKARARA